MSVVLIDPEGFAIDWDWQCRLTVWAVHGDRFGDKIIEHRLAAHPGRELRARRVARRWWREQGRSQSTEATRPPAPEGTSRQR